MNCTDGRKTSVLFICGTSCDLFSTLSVEQLICFVDRDTYQYLPMQDPDLVYVGMEDRGLGLYMIHSTFY